MVKDLIKIKKHYGEKMAHLCATLFPTILENDGVLFQLISSKFSFSKFLCDDIIKQGKIREFQSYILSFSKQEKNIIENNCDPFYLMDKAGYILYECKNNDDIQRFKKYYASRESLCTFYEDRLKTHYVFFAVKKDVNTIKRADFINPDRQDKYGTSVISIQFTRGLYNNVSIKNRYNDTVINADATFSNNLENIIPGLTDSFRKKYHFNLFVKEFDFILDGYYKDASGKYYKYNYCLNNVYYGTNNTIIDISGTKEYAKEKYLILDYFILDLVKKKISLYDHDIEDSFIDIPPIENIRIVKIGDNKRIIIETKNNEIELLINSQNQIIKYKSNLAILHDNFLINNKTLTCFENQYLNSVGHNFLARNNARLTVNTPNLALVGDCFLSENSEIKECNYPNLQKVGSMFMKSCMIKNLFFSKLVEVGNDFLHNNYSIEVLNTPKLQFVGDNFLYSSRNLSLFIAPNLVRVGDYFLFNNRKMENLYFPNLLSVGRAFAYYNEIIKTIYLPKVLKIDDSFLYYNKKLTMISLPAVLKIKDHFISHNNLIEKLDIPNVIAIGDNFLKNNDCLSAINLPRLIKVGHNFLYTNEIIHDVNLPNLRKCGNYFIPMFCHINTLNINNHIQHGLFFLANVLASNKKYLSNEKELVKSLLI